METLQALAMVGGYADENYAMARAVEHADQCLRRFPSGAGSNDTTVAVVFHIAGPMFGPDFKGMQRDGFSKRDRILGFKVAVPDPFPPRTEDAFVCAALAQAVDMAQEFSRARSLDWSFEQLRGAMEPLRECLNVAGPVPDVSYWLSPKKAELTEPAEVDTMLSVQLRTRALAPTQADVVLRQRLEQLLEDVLGRDGSGYVDGGDTGSGMMGVYVRVAQPIATQTVLNALRQAGHLDAATVVLRRQDPNVAEEEQYEVVWPEGYSGPVEPGDLFAGLVE